MLPKVVFITLVICTLQTLVQRVDGAYENVTQNVYIYKSPTGPYLSMFIVTKDGVMVIEPFNTKHATLLLATIRKVTSNPIKYLFISHNHWDHASGGKVFQDVGAKVVIHKKAYYYLKANKKPSVTLPDEKWEGRKKSYTVGGVTLELYYFGRSHGYGMTTFLLPKQKICYLADMGLPKQVLIGQMPDYDIKGTLTAFKEIKDLDFTRVFFAHQSGMKGGTKDDRIGTYQYLKGIIDGVAAEFKKGTNIMNISNNVKLPQYKNWKNYNTTLSENVLRVMMDQNMGPFYWDESKSEGNDSAAVTRHACFFTTVSAFLVVIILHL